jgi:undecaprenyl-diphosphatase
MNDAFFFFLYGFAHQSKILDDVVIFFAVYVPYLVIILAGLFLLFHHEVFGAAEPLRVFMQKKKEILLVFFAGILAWLVDTLLKFLIHTPRPFDVFPQVHPLFAESWYSFPSGHATFFMALAFSLFFSHKKAGYVFMFFALIIGIARIISGVHFPVDILGGFVIGALVAFFVKSV